MPASAAGSLGAGTATVVPQKGARPAPPRQAVTPRPTRNRRAKLALRRIDPWSVFISSLALSFLLALVTIVASLVLYSVLGALGVTHSINTNIGKNIIDNPQLITRGKFVGIAALIGGANVVFLTALATFGAMLYNLVASTTGGIELTLAERD